MFGDFLNRHITSQAKFVEYGYGQVEPNHLSAQRNGQIYAQLPADKTINVLEQGQFVKYDYAKGVVDFTGEGEWMLVFNEIKLYRDGQYDCEFAMVKDNYEARIYSPFGAAKDGAVDTVNFDGQGTRQSRYYNGKDNLGNTSFQMKEPTYTLTSDQALDAEKTYYVKNGDEYEAVEAPDVEDIATYYEMTDAGVAYPYDDVTAGPDMYEPFYNEDPFHIEVGYKEARMPEGTKMVPRVFKTMVGDIYTTNTVDEATLAVGDILAPRAADGILVKDNAQAMKWQVVKVYTMPDHQKGVKVMRIA